MDKHIGTGTIAIIGAGHHVSGKTILNQLNSIGYNDVVVVSPETTIEKLQEQIQPYIISMPQPACYQGEEKRFVCKGIHEYREVKGKWICQCGRNIND